MNPTTIDVKRIAREDAIEAYSVASESISVGKVALVSEKSI